MQSILTHVVTNIVIPLILKNKMVIEYLSMAKKSMSRMDKFVSSKIDNEKRVKLMDLCSTYTNGKSDTYTGKETDTIYGKIKLIERHLFTKEEVREMNTMLEKMKSEIENKIHNLTNFRKLANCGRNFVPCEFNKQSYLNEIAKGNCPKRNDKESMGEALCRSYVLILTGTLCDNVRPKWLVNPKTNRTLELDIYDEDEKYAIEVNGKHHYTDTDKENDQIWRDSVKHHVCKTKGIKLIDVPYCIKHSLIGYSIYIHLLDNSVKMI